jgi:hypothetical protein
MMMKLEEVITVQEGTYTVVGVSNEQWLCPDCVDGLIGRPKSHPVNGDRLSRIFLVVIVATGSHGLQG